MRHNDDRSDEMNRFDEVLRDESVWADPPGHVAPALMAEIAGGAPLPSQGDAVTKQRRWLWPAAAALVAVAATLLFVFAGPLTESPPEPSLVFAVGGDGVTGQAEVGAAEAGWWIRLEISGLDPAPAGTYYEGWLSNGADQVSVGTFHMRDGGSVVLWSGVPVSEFPELRVTREVIADAVGPSGELVMEGRADE